ncbi:insecticidal delta-endotoxin Cry8Ea1 family protein [Cupriavidus metallidurans]|uniref:insecticidal delta-endotoxin Cry8Ea1 family protein n=1 Tax=Cupriavidus metallidurans TaxID=119219 RepID=UPI001F2ADD59|nr:insecticidal delta-endotoxin Cry8Ea1 family protein [Cupriavidus metallidurans]
MIAIPAMGVAAATGCHATEPGDSLRSDFKDPDITDPLEDLKAVLQVLLGEIPVVGSSASALLGLLWPWNRDVWDDIRGRVEALINQKIEEAVFSLLKQKLNGIADTLKLYVSAASTGDTQNMMMQFVATNTSMVAASREFRNPDFQWKIAPLFAVFAQLHMVLLRDVALNGKDWSWNAKVYESYVKLATDTAQDYGQYLDDVAQAERKRLAEQAPTSPGQHRTNIHNYWQPFAWQRITLLSDFRVLVAAMDPVTHPGPVHDLPYEDVYSKAYGTADNWDNTARGWADGVTTPFARPLANPSSIYIEYFNGTPRVVDVRYPSAMGPMVFGGRRTDVVGIIANRAPGVETRTVTIPAPVGGARFNIVGASIRSGSIPLTLVLKLDDGTSLTLWNRTDLRAPMEDVPVPSGRKLTTLTMWTRSRFYQNDLGCLVIGFSRDPDDVPQRTRDLLYITSTGEDLNTRLLRSSGISRRLQEQRDAYWKWLRSAR